MKQEEQVPLSEEAKDPKLPEIHAAAPGARAEIHRRNDRNTRA